MVASYNDPAYARISCPCGKGTKWMQIGGLRPDSLEEADLWYRYNQHAEMCRTPPAGQLEMWRPRDQPRGPQRFQGGFGKLPGRSLGQASGGGLVGSGRCLKGLGGFDGAAVDHAGLESTFRAMAAAA